MEPEVVLEVVERGRGRLARRRAWRWGGLAMLAWAGAMLALLIARLVVPITLPLEWLVAGGVAAVVIAAVALSSFWRLPPRLAAQIVDLRFRCADRLTTAVEVITGAHPPTPLGPALVADAARTALGLDLRRGLPAGPSRAFWAAALVLLLVILTAPWLVGLSLPGTPAREVAQTIKREGRRLERAGETLEEQARADRARLSRRIAPSIRRLGEQLRRERVDRAEALARIESLNRQVQEARRQVESRRSDGQQAPPAAGRTPPSDLFRRRAATDRMLKQIRELTDRMAQARTPEERAALMRQLADLAGGGQEGDVPARVREQAETARQQMAAGDTGGARRTLQQGATDLEELRAMLADEEGLQQAQRDLNRSAERIARGRPGSPAETEETPRAAGDPGSVAPGSRPLPEGEGPTAEPPPGPNQGTTAGQGSPAEKLGDRTPRLEADKQQNRVRGLQGEGRVTTSDLLGPGRPGQVRAPQRSAVAAGRGEADRYLSRMRIPPEYREIVRRYFEALAAPR
jgi:hypothetical protein